MQAALHEALIANEINLPTNAETKLLNYLLLLKKWNRVFNLTTIVDPTDMIYLHLIDSLLIAQNLHGNRFLDVGSGAGLPGIPLAILMPENHFTLLDKNSKKTRFLTQAIHELELKNVTVAHQSVEAFKPNDCFDSILSRAFGTLRLLVESANHLLCAHGLFIAMKGKYPQTEINDLPADWQVSKTIRINIKGINHLDRHLICLRKQ